MFSSGVLIMVTLLALAVGIALGVLIAKQLDPNRRKNSELAQKLAESEKRFSDYQNEVTEHFTETSQRVYALTKNYKEVHDYLANSAIKLASPTVSKQLFSSAQITLPGGRSESDDAEDHTVIDYQTEPSESTHSENTYPENNEANASDSGDTPSNRTDFNKWIAEEMQRDQALADATSTADDNTKQGK